MTFKNLWGELPAGTSIVTPYSVLREQAANLTNSTNGVLTGVVERQASGERFVLRLIIVVSSLDNYRYVVVVLNHDVRLYPLQIMAPSVPGLNVWMTCDDEDALMDKLERILRSDHTQKVILALLAQAAE